MGASEATDGATEQMRRGGSLYRPRLADVYLSELMAEFPAVLITGARATGKTTTAAQRVRQVDSLDMPGVAAAYRADPDAALRRAARPVLLDEWQEVPEVLAAVKRAVDRDQTPGQFLLTGSVRAEPTNELWAGTGRIVRTEIFGVTERELAGRLNPDQPAFLTTLARGALDQLGMPTSPPDIDEYLRLAVRGGFPEIAYRQRSGRARGLWLASYLDDLLTRDAAVLDARKDPAKLRRYLHALALNIAGMPTDATLYQAANVDAKTAAGYEQLLRNLYVLTQVPAWSSNRLSRLTKAAKRYLIDTGLAATAANLTLADILTDPSLTGRFFDAFAATQLRPEVALMFPRPTAHHLRIEGGRREVDLVFDLGAGRVVALEFKAGAAPRTDDAKHLFWLRDQLGTDFLAGAVIHTGPGLFELGDRVHAVPLCAMWS
jgi:predicted AAA+ superfamily ATPase